VLLLPAFILIDNVTPASVPELITHFINPASTTTTPLHDVSAPINQPKGTINTNSSTEPPSLAGLSLTPSNCSKLTTTMQLRSRPSPYKYLILLCSQRTRDARCGQSAPLLRREFERHLRTAGLYRDPDDERPGGAAVLFISHVGGHKYSANVMVYRRGDGEGDEGAQCIWLARVRPQDCEGIVKFTVLQGKVVHPERQLRGGFDRGRGLISW
jgi:hypothetical protein